MRKEHLINRVVGNITALWIFLEYFNDDGGKCENVYFHVDPSHKSWIWIVQASGSGILYIFKESIDKYWCWLLTLPEFEMLFSNFCSKKPLSVRSRVEYLHFLYFFISCVWVFLYFFCVNLCWVIELEVAMPIKETFHCCCRRHYCRPQNSNFTFRSLYLSISVFFVFVFLCFFVFVFIICWCRRHYYRP